MSPRRRCVKNILAEGIQTVCLTGYVNLANDDTTVTGQY